MCQDEFVVKNRFFDKRCGFNFFPRKCPGAVELNLKHTELTNVVEQMRNVSTWSVIGTKSERGALHDILHVAKKTLRKGHLHKKQVLRTHTCTIT